MKYCTRGKHDVDIALFRKSSRTKDGLQSWCTPCFAEYERVRYQTGDRERKERNKQAAIKRAQDFIWSVLEKSECVDCGETDPLVLEFDHRGNAPKLYNVSEMMNLSVTLIAAEIAKCDIRCANCHKRKTAMDFGFWRTLR